MSGRMEAKAKDGLPTEEMLRVYRVVEAAAKKGGGGGKDGGKAGDGMSVKASDIRYTETALGRAVEVCGTLTVVAGLPVSNQQIYEARDYDLLEVVREAIRKEIDRIVYGEVRQIAQELRRELTRVLPCAPPGIGTQTQAIDLIGRLMEAARVQPEPEAEGEKGAGE